MKNTKAMPETMTKSKTKTNNIKDFHHGFRVFSSGDSASWWKYFEKPGSWRLVVMIMIIVTRMVMMTNMVIIMIIVMVMMVIIMMMVIRLGCTQIPISTLSHIWFFLRLYGIVFVIIAIIIIIIMIIKSEGVNAQL